MNREEEWRVEIFRSDDVLIWNLVFVVDGKDYVTDHGQAQVVSDMFHAVGKALEGYLPVMFT